MIRGSLASGLLRPLDLLLAICNISFRRPMNWTGEYIIEANGLCHWHESLRVTDPDLAKACSENLLMHLFLESWVQLGVKVGVA